MHIMKSISRVALNYSESRAGSKFSDGKLFPQNMPFFINKCKTRCGNMSILTKFHLKKFKLFQEGCNAIFSIFCFLAYCLQIYFV